MSKALDEATLAASIREVTDDEVAFYHEHGWVKLDRLVAPELAELLRREAMEQLEWDEPVAGILYSREPEKDGVTRLEPFRSFLLSRQMGYNAQRLMNRRRLSDIDVPVRCRGGLFGRREPVEGAPGSPYHQDSGEHGSDRVGEFNAWLALAEVTPEMGAMRFLDGVHKEGPLESGFRDPFATYTKLLDLYPLSPPLHYQAGDMTVHHGYMIHGAPPNTTDRTRWHYLISYCPADTRYWSGTVENNGSKRTLLTDEQHPIVVPGS